jgi:O-antigen ligase
MNDFLAMFALAAFLACYAFVAYRSRLIALSLLILVAPWRSILSHLGGAPFVMGSAPVGLGAIVLDGMLVLLLAGWLLAHIISGRPPYLPVRSMAVYLATMALFVVISPSLLGGMVGFRNTALVVAIAIMAADEVKNERDLIVLAAAVIGGALPFGVLGIAQFYYGSLLPGWLQYETGGSIFGLAGYFRANGTIGNPLVYGHFMGLFVLMLYPLATVMKARLEPCTFVGLFIGILAVAVSLSRSSWYGLLLGLAVVTVLNWRNGAWRGARSLIGAIGAITAVTVLLLGVNRDMRHVFASRFLSADVASQQTTITRLEAGQYGVTRLWSKHILGVGLGRYGAGYARFVPLSEEERVKINGVFVSDNYYLKILVETGVMGLIAFILLLAETLMRLARSARSSKGNIPRALAIGGLGCAVATVVIGLFSNSLDSRIVGLYFWLCVGLGLGAEKVSAISRPETANLVNGDLNFTRRRNG